MSETVQQNRVLASGTQRLNPVDQVMRCADDTIRQMGYPGIETQMLVWLGGRVDTGLLRGAIARLCHRHPVVASRLVEPCGGRDDRPYWQFRPGNVCELRETMIASDAPQAVLDYAAQTLSGGRDPVEADPLEIHLLHRPGGNDVVLLQYNHVLMDNRMAVPLLRELDRLSTGEDCLVPENPWNDCVLEHWRGFPREKRRDAVRAAIELQARAMRGRAASLLPVNESPSGPARIEMRGRTVRAKELAGFRARVASLCGFPCVSMAVLASAFRAIDHFGPAGDDRRHFAAGIGIPLLNNVPDTLVFQNLTSAIPMRLQRHDLRDRDQAIRLLAEQLRQRLTAAVDLGALGAIALFGGRRHYIDWVVWYLVRYGYSLWYGYFGALDAAGGTFCGTRIEELFHAGGPIWPSIGLTLLVNQYRGRMHLLATYDPRLISSGLAEAVLDFMLADLPCGAPRRPTWRGPEDDDE